MVQFAYDTIVAKTNTDLKQEQNNMAKVKNSDNAEQKKDDIVND
ncbi:hypothetical protein [Lactobacillus crispatus]